LFGAGLDSRQFLSVYALCLFFSCFFGLAILFLFLFILVIFVLPFVLGQFLRVHLIQINIIQLLQQIIGIIPSERFLIFLIMLIIFPEIILLFAHNPSKLIEMLI